MGKDCQGERALSFRQEKGQSGLWERNGRATSVNEREAWKGEGTKEGRNQKIRGKSGEPVLGKKKRESGEGD